jgi:hypothetical protein
LASAQANSNSAMNSDPPSIWTALTGLGICWRTRTKNSAAFFEGCGYRIERSMVMAILITAAPS